MCNTFLGFFRNFARRNNKQGNYEEGFRNNGSHAADCRGAERLLSKSKTSE